MKICNSCHRQFGDDLAFCQYCGVALSDAVAPTPDEKTFFCTNCGHSCAVGAKFCAACGFAFGMDPQPTPIPGGTIGGTVSPVSYQEDTILVSLQTGKNTVFGTSTGGTLTLSADEVTYNISLTLSFKAQNHRYRYGEIQSARTMITRLGLTPLPALEVVLKDGTVYRYIYSPLQKQHISDICQKINSRIS